MNTLVICLCVITLGVVCHGQDKVCLNPLGPSQAQDTTSFNATDERPRAKKPKSNIRLRMLGSRREKDEYKKAVTDGNDASKINSLLWKPALWTNLCPTKYTSIKPAIWFLHGNTVCFTPKPFSGYSYPTVVCNPQRCPMTKPGYYCRREGLRVYTIYVYCLDGSKWVIRKHPIYTWRCCVCKRYGCIFRAVTANGTVGEPQPEGP